jgi:hypothetical protein
MPAETASNPPTLDTMFDNAFAGRYRPLPSGISWDPVKVWLYVDVLLAQAETLKRLRRDPDVKRKLLWAMSVATASVADQSAEKKGRQFSAAPQF